MNQILSSDEQKEDYLVTFKVYQAKMIKLWFLGYGFFCPNGSISQVK